MRTVKVYYSPSCAFSAGTVSFLLSRGADFEAVNLEQDPARREKLEQRLGGKKLETPTLEVDGQLHVAPSLSALKGLLEQWGLPEAAAPHQQLKQLRT